MEAVVLKQAGGAENLVLQSCVMAKVIRDDCVLVRLHAVGVNPIDTKIRQTPERFPLGAEAVILGCDGAGVIEAVGAAVTDFAVGDEVYYCQCGFNGRQGNYAEYAVVDQVFLAKKPQSIGFEEAAAAPLVLITAWEALHDRVALQAGQTVLIHAGAGGVGHVAIQLAKAIGARVVTTVSSQQKADFVSALGADHVIRYQDEDFVVAVNEWTANEGVDVVFDTVGGELIEKSFSVTKVYGDVVTILAPPAETNWGVARQRNLRFSQELMLTPTLLELADAKAHQGEILQRCAVLFEQGKLNVNVAQTFELADAAEAHRYLETQHPMGKVVLTL